MSIITRWGFYVEYFLEHPFFRRACICWGSVSMVSAFLSRMYFVSSAPSIPYSHCPVFVVSNPLCILRVQYVSSQCTHFLLCPLHLSVVSSQHYGPLVTAVHCLFKTLCHFVYSEEPILGMTFKHSSPCRFLHRAVWTHLAFLFIFYERYCSLRLLSWVATTCTWTPLLWCACIHVVYWVHFLSIWWAFVSRSGLTLHAHAPDDPRKTIHIYAWMHALLMASYYGNAADYVSACVRNAYQALSQRAWVRGYLAACFS